MQINATVEEALELAQGELRAEVAEKRAEADELDEQATALEGDANQLDVDRERVALTAKTIAARLAQAEALRGTLGRAILGGRDERELAHVEEIHDAKLREIAGYEAELDELNRRASEAERLRVSAAELGARADALRADAHDLERRIKTGLQKLAPELAVDARRRLKEQRELQRRVLPTEPPRPSDLIPNEIVLEGPVRGITGLVKS